MLSNNNWVNPDFLFNKKYTNILKEDKISILEDLIREEKIQSEKSFVLNEMKRIGIEELPYSYSALKPFIDSKTMNIHYNKHYKGYVKKLNNALSKRKGGDVELEDIIKSISKYNDDVRNNAGGAFNHALFWNMLSPKKTNPSKELTDKIKKDFGSLQKFKTTFEEIAKARFGSGWVWLIITNNKKLKVVSTPNQDNPLMNVVKGGGFPLLGLDLWEHAYYLKYQNKRDEYISNFWNVVNWDFVSKMYEMKTKTNLTESVLSKRILMEDNSECTREHEKIIQSIFNQNENVKWTFMRGINNILKSVFSDNWYEKNEYENDTLSGVYDLEGPGRSVINKMNTNYSAFCILLVDVNKVLNVLGRPKIKITNVSPQEQIRQTHNFVKIIDEFKFRIFNKESNTFKKIMEKLVKTNKLGDSAEDLTVKRLEKKFGEGNVIKIGKLGSLRDAIGGIDVEVTNDQFGTSSSQVKSFSKIQEKNGKITIFDVSNVGMYNTDWLIFTNSSKTLVFRNKGVQIIDGNYVIPSENLLYELK